MYEIKKRLSEGRMASVAGLALALLASVGRAGVINGDTADAGIAGSSVVDLASGEVWAGCQDWYQLRHFVAVFQLPNLGADAAPFTSATLNLTLVAAWGSGHVKADLIQIPARSSASVLGTDVSAGTGIAGSFFSTSSPLGTKTIDVKAFLNAQYAGGAGAGKYVFFRLSGNDYGHTYLGIATANNATASNRPRIDYDYTPQPPAGTVVLIQ